MANTVDVHPASRRGWRRLGTGAALLTLAALAAWSGWDNLALRDRLAVLERENHALRQAALTQPAPAPAVAPAVSAAPAADAPPPRPSVATPAGPGDPLAAYARLPASTPRRGPLEEALQRLREPVPAPGASPFGRR